jgi:hypothetical protein
MIAHYDHRFGYYAEGQIDDTRALPRPSIAQKSDAAFQITPRCWVPCGEVAQRLGAKGWSRGWLLGWRDITNGTNERTIIPAVFPTVGVGNSLPLLLTGSDISPRLTTMLAMNLSSLVLDFCARNKIGGTHVNFFMAKQLPILSPVRYSEALIQSLIPIAIELIYTANDMRPWAKDLGYDGLPFGWNEQRRAHLRADLDAAYAHLYGLTRDDLRYILDPADIYGPDFPSETFRVLKEREIKQYGEYRSCRLILAAWDRLTADGTFHSWAL